MNEDIELYKIGDKFDFEFCIIPRQVIKNFSLSLEAKFAYILLLDRFKVSKMNKWINDKGEVFLNYTRKELIKQLKVGNHTIVRVFNELKNFKLIKEEKVGVGKPNRIYLVKLKQVVSIKAENHDAKQTVKKVLNSILSGAIWHTNNNNIDNNKQNKNIKEEKISVTKNVKLYKEEIKELIDKYGTEKVADFITFLDSYKEKNNKEYTSDYEAIACWVITKVNNDESKNNIKVKKESIKLKSLSDEDIQNLDKYYDIY